MPTDAIPELVSSRWSLAIVRECGRGTNRFEAIRRSLGITRRILSSRLASLAAEGVIVRSQYQERPARFEYVLTDKGRALSPVLEAIERWDRAWHDTVSERLPEGGEPLLSENETVRAEPARMRPQTDG